MRRKLFKFIKSIISILGLGAFVCSCSNNKSITSDTAMPVISAYPSSFYFKNYLYRDVSRHNLISYEKDELIGFIIKPEVLDEYKKKYPNLYFVSDVDFYSYDYGDAIPIYSFKAYPDLDYIDVIPGIYQKVIT